MKRQKFNYLKFADSRLLIYKYNNLKEQMDMLTI